VGAWVCGWVGGWVGWLGMGWTGLSSAGMRCAGLGLFVHFSFCFFVYLEGAHFPNSIGIT